MSAALLRLLMWWKAYSGGVSRAGYINVVVFYQNLYADEASGLNCCVITLKRKWLTVEEINVRDENGRSWTLVNVGSPI